MDTATQAAGFLAGQSTFFSRLGGWFKRSAGQGSAQERATSSAESSQGPADVPVVAGTLETRSTFLRPWTRRDATVEQLQTGMLAISEVMGTIRCALERQAKRQDEIVEQIERQGMQHSQVARVLDRISKADGERRRALEAIVDRVDWINRNEHNLTQNLTNVGIMLQSLDRHSDISAQVLREIRDGMHQQEKKLYGRIRSQNRLTILLMTGILLSIGALAATGMLGYFGFNVLSHFVK